MRLDKLLTELNKGSRSEVKRLLRKGQVTVNGETIKTPDYKVDASTDNIVLQGERLQYEPLVYYMLHKPTGVVSAVSDNTAGTVIELLKEENRKGLFPIGRLDKDTEGLLIITNDGQFAHNLLSPKKHIPKTYYVRINGRITREEIQQMKEGIAIGDDKPTLPAELRIIGEQEDEALITITEGRFHQVKRMFQFFGQRVLYLKRIAMGSLELDENLPLGAYRKLEQEEIERLKNAYGKRSCDI